MIEIRTILIPALKSALITATGLTVYDSLPIHLDGTEKTPCINISDVYVDEDGPKNQYHYNVNVLLEVIHKSQSSLQPLYTSMNKVLGIINNRVPFELTGGYEIMDCRLNNTTTTKATTAKGLINIGIIRIVFRIK